MAHVEKIAWKRAIEGADSIEAIGVLGWNLIAEKGEFEVGDKCVFFEIDSKLPEKEWSEFLRPKGFKIKTLKLNKFKVWSQGLAIPISVIPEVSDDTPEGTDVTELIGVKYSVVEDNIRKAKADPDAKYKSMTARHKELAKKKWFRWLMKRDWGKKLLFLFLGKKKDNPKGFPDDWIRRTDEVRIENVPFYLNGSEEWLLSEKLDGSSVSVGLKHIKGNKYDFAVCSRNVRQMDRDQATYHGFNIYWELTDKYNIEKVLRHYMAANGCETVVLQGEGVGNVQGNPYKLKENDLYCFNLYVDGVRKGTLELKEFCDFYGLKCVPIIETHHKLPATMEEMKLEADGYSVINPQVKREGLVYRTLDGQKSFKNVSREYLLKHGG